MKRLLIRPGAIGDVILSLPALEALRADYTEVWSRREVLPLIRFADRTRAIADTGIELLGVREGHRVPALDEFDEIHSWYGSGRDEFRHAVADLPFKFYPALPPPPGIPSIPVSRKKRGDHAILHPFASALGKRWPMENFRHLGSVLPMPVRWCAGPEEALDGAVRIEDLYELGQWIASARVYVGNDSGISHLAAAVGTPTVAIFLDSDPHIWSPRGDRVAVLCTPTVEDVRRAVIDLLRRVGGH